MNYEEFIETMKYQVRETLGMEVNVQVYEALKNNGVKRVGLVLKKSDINMAPTIYMEEFFCQYLEGIQIPELVDSIERLYEQVRQAKSYPYEKILEYQNIKDKIVYKLICQKTNKKFLEEVPYEEFFDLAAVPYVVFENTEFGYATLQIRKEHLESWGVDAQEVMDAARRNSPEILPLEIGQLTESMYVMTNVNRSFGASAVCYPGALEKAWNVIGEDFFLLPSSVHEFLMIPLSFGAEVNHLKMIVKEVNDTEVRDEEVLSDQVYYYSGTWKQMYMR